MLYVEAVDDRLDVKREGIDGHELEAEQTRDDEGTREEGATEQRQRPKPRFDVTYWIVHSILK